MQDKDGCKKDVLVGALSQNPVRDASLHWYAAYVGEGREDTRALQCQKLLGSDLVESCFVPKWECSMKRQGVWRSAETPMFKGYIVLVTRDVRALAKALSGLSIRVELAGKCGVTYAPFSADVQHWLEGALDDAHVLRASEGVIEGKDITVTRGPLAGREGCIAKINRHKRMALVALGRGSESFLIKASLSVPVKTPVISAG